jgi:hypothetical protein
MFGAGMALVKEPSQGGTQIFTATERGFKKRLLHIAGNVAPDVDRRSAKPEREVVVFFLDHFSSCADDAWHSLWFPSA